MSQSLKFSSTLMYCWSCQFQNYLYCEISRINLFDSLCNRSLHHLKVLKCVNCELPSTINMRNLENNCVCRPSANMWVCLLMTLRVINTGNVGRTDDLLWTVWTQLQASTGTHSSTSLRKQYWKHVSVFKLRLKRLWDVFIC